MSNQLTPTASSAIYESLESIAVGTARVADHVRAYPADTSAALESAQAIAKQYSDLTDQASKFADENRRLRETAAEVNKTAGWVGSNFSGGGGVSVNNSFGRVVGSFSDLLGR